MLNHDPPPPARDEGPKMPQRKVMQRMICRGLNHSMLRYITRSMNFWVSIDIKFVVSPTVRNKVITNIIID